MRRSFELEAGSRTVCACPDDVMRLDFSLLCRLYLLSELMSFVSMVPRHNMLRVGCRYLLERAWYVFQLLFGGH